MSEVQRKPEISQSKYQLLSSGHEFYDNVVERIGQAQRFIIIKSFLWRNDEAGQLIAKALKEAADRGVKVLIAKDRMGAFYEYSEGNGQSFFHDSPSKDASIFNPHRLTTIATQAKWMAGFYKNGVKPLQENLMRKEVVHHNNITVIDQYKMYDHSKCILIDGETSYVGGINFGDEYRKEDKKRYIDYMLRIDGGEEADELLRAITTNTSNGGEYNRAIQFITDGAPHSIHQKTLEFIRGTREKLMIALPYFGHPDYIHALAGLINKQAKVSLLMPKTPNLHGARNAHFVKRLRRETSGSNSLTVSLIPQMFHGKMMLRDNETAFFGSHNLATDEGVLNELNILTSIPEIVEPLKIKMDQHFSDAELSADSPSWLKILPASRLEYCGVELQTLICRLREQEIRRVRTFCQEQISSQALPLPPYSR